MLWHLQTINSLQSRWGLRTALSVYLHRQSTRNSNEVKRIRLPEVEGDVFLRPRSTDWGVLNQVFVEQEYAIRSPAHAEALFRHYQATIDAGDTPVIIDCGANSGLASIWYSHVFPEAIVVAVEPEPENYSVLCRNAGNRLNIRPLQAGISDQKGRITLHNPGHGHWSWQTVENATGEVETVTIPDLLSAIPRGKLLIVKIDIEGSEVNLFRSNTAWANETPLIVFESHDLMANWHGTAHAVLSVLTREPRDYFQEGENTLAFSHALLGPREAKSVGLDLPGMANAH
ncbi:FkbM family methyltransferase [Rhizobium cauense]|uniref:FkbM family methyltransferase n=1 Tax=Rhizobium cauense TaxID=1166683 RepID=UPI001C6F2405|nr:FkbM family methyltransferase [Rhizobium cauense]MBW9112232.1 FkbM family methyltransferase [Rhizobium cauense]